MQPVSLANFLYKIFANTGNALMPSYLRTPFGARHVSTGFWFLWVGCVHISNWKVVGPHLQPERVQSKSPTRKGPVHIPNQKGANLYSQLESGRSISPTGKGPIQIPD